MPTRRSLLSRLRDWDDQQSWREFFDTYGKLIYGLARKCGLTDAESQDVVQETLIAVARKMPGFKYDPAIGSFKGWLFQITRRRVADQFRKRPEQVVAAGHDQREDRTATIERVPDLNSPDLTEAWDRHWEENLLQTALARIKRRIKPKQYQMFDLYALQQWPMDAITETLGVNRAQVYMAKVRVGLLLRHELDQLRDKGHRSQAEG